MFQFFKNIAESSSDEELMQALSKGNRKAFELLYDRYFARLVNFCKRILYDNEPLAEDIVQEVFVKIIHQPNLFDTSKVFSTWVYTMAKNQCLNQLRNEQNRKQLLQKNYSLSDSMLSHNNADAEILKKKIAEVFATLNDKEKAIYVLRFEQELSIKEIAEIVDIPEGSVKSGIFYMLKKMKVQLKDYTHVN